MVYYRESNENGSSTEDMTVMVFVHIHFNRNDNIQLIRLLRNITLAKICYQSFNKISLKYSTTNLNTHISLTVLESRMNAK